MERNTIILILVVLGIITACIIVYYTVMKKDCQLSELNWSTCDKPCGGGKQIGTRTITQEAKYGGNECGELTVVQPCNTQACSVDCQVSDWSDWGTCDKTCGGGTTHRNRTVTHPSIAGGNACPNLIENKTCNTQPCSVDCQVSDWSEWGTCDKTCGGGTSKRNRTITKPARYGGNACPELIENKTCNIQPCPIDCQVSDWSLSECDKPCGGGTRIGNRTIVQPAMYGGNTCPELIENTICNTQPCPIDCQVSDWIWGGCTKPCGEGIRIGNRTVTQPSMYGGNACPELMVGEYCNHQPCPIVTDQQNPIDCQVSDWNWSECDKLCGGGIQIGNRTVIQPSMYGGNECPHLIIGQSCNEQACPVTY